ncbi:LysR family transcriptional regulator, partial [Escherichia coli]|uniref:LysR family transcriptional regulator n=1 Tax=Escherichia coli TaxID=562 RepID=UPI003F7E15AD
MKGGAALAGKEGEGYHSVIAFCYGPSAEPVAMNLKQLEYFVAVAELGSFSKAAVILNIAQPALSRQVRLLETGLH